jgi:hypothetical protein
VLAWCALAAVAGAPKDLRGINGPNTLVGTFFLGVWKGKVRLTKNGAGRCDWVIEHTRDGTLIRK